MARLALHRPSASLRAVALAGAAALAMGLPLASAAEAAAASHSGPVLTSVHASRHRGYDQLVFAFSGRRPPRASHRFVLRLPAGPALAGRARVLVTFAGATGSGPARRVYDLPALIQLVTAGHQGGGLSFGIGLARHAQPRVRMLTRPARVVMDFPTPARLRTSSVYFAQVPAGLNQAGVPASRIAPVTGRSAVILWRLFAGPTRQEKALGLRFVSSGATGFRALTIRSGIARVHLTGACHAGRSSVTVGTEITETLLGLPGVAAVKVYDPAGLTQDPGGPASSLPSCLAPMPPTGPLLGTLAILIAAGIFIGLVLSVLSLVRGLILRPNVISPAAYQAERVTKHPVGTGEFAPDTAWPSYPLRQLRADLGQIEAQRRSLYRMLWKWRPRRVLAVLLLPVWLVAIFCFLVAGLTTVLLTGLYALALLACAAVAAGLSGAGLVLLRGAGQAWHKAIGAAASCPRCYHVTDRPAYRCPGCLDLHRDVRPGRLGLVSRRCQCGKLLPTMVLRAARALQPVCQKCRRPLRAGAAAVRDVRVPVFGDTSAGKTRFLFAALDGLVQITRQRGIPFGFPDEESENQATMALKLIRSGRDTVKTSMGLPSALTCRVGKGAGTALVHLFDAAGEAYHNADLHDSLGYLDQGHGLVYVLDPFSVGAVRDQLSSQKADVIRRAQAAAGDPENAYSEVVSRLRDSGVTAAGQRLAVVVSKADLLIAGGLKPPVESAAISRWLEEHGIHNLVRAAQRDFAEVRFFTVASLAVGEVLPDHAPGAPLQWLLSASGLRMLAESAGPKVPRSRSGAADDSGTRTEKDDPAKAPS